MNVKNINKQALAQTYYILSDFCEINRNKIPSCLINTIIENMDKQYMNTDELLEETKEILYAILNKYVLSQSQKNKLEEYYKFCDAKMEEEKKKKYNHENLFNNKKERKQVGIKENTKKSSLVKYEENIFIKILNKIKNIVKRD